MAKIQLLGGAYSSDTLSAGAQTCLNLYPEAIPEAQQEPEPVVHKLRPGLQQILSIGPGQEVRGLYTASNGYLFAVVGPGIFWVNYAPAGGYQATLVATMATNSGLVSMQDNQIDMLVTDGTSAGYYVTLPFDGSVPKAATINAASQSSTNGFGWQGASSLDYVDTFFVGTIPGTNQFFSSLSNSLIVDPTYVVAVSGAAGQLAGLAVVDRYIWLIGTVATSLFYDSGGQFFPFAIVDGPFIQYGCIAPKSIVRAREAVFWMGQDRRGAGVFIKGSQYKAARVSNHALEAEWQSYLRLTDVRGWSYQINGHDFIVLNFPSADKTWVYDDTTSQWHQASSTGSDGLQHQWIVQCATQWQGMVVVGGTTSGALYRINDTLFDDAGALIRRERNFPHITDEGERQSFHNFIANMEAGNTDLDYPTQEFPSDVANPTASFLVQPPAVFLSWSNDRGRTFGNPIQQTLGGTGQTQVSLRWNRLGIARDRVYKLAWNSRVKTNLIDAYVQYGKRRT